VEPDPEAIVEALLFASAQPLREEDVQRVLEDRASAREVLARLEARYRNRGVRLECRKGLWAFRTAPEVAPFLARRVEGSRRLSRAALETLAAIAYNQPVTRAEVEALRGVSTSKGVFDQLLALGLIAPRGRKEAPGRPLLWGTTAAFLDHFGLESLEELPRPEDLEDVSGWGSDRRDG